MLIFICCLLNFPRQKEKSVFLNRLCHLVFKLALHNASWFMDLNQLVLLINCDATGLVPVDDLGVGVLDSPLGPFVAATVRPPPPPEPTALFFRLEKPFFLRYVTTSPCPNLSASVNGVLPHLQLLQLNINHVNRN